MRSGDVERECHTHRGTEKSDNAIGDTVLECPRELRCETIGFPTIYKFPDPVLDDRVIEVFVWSLNKHKQHLVYDSSGAYHATVKEISILHQMLNLFDTVRHSLLRRIFLTSGGILRFWVWEKGVADGYSVSDEFFEISAKSGSDIGDLHVP